MSMKAKHTPGPWILKEYDGDYEICAEGNTQHDGHGWNIATVHGSISNDGDSRSNAKLIAAAPDLLSALEHALAALDDAMKNHTHWIYADAQQEALQAIAKAEGRTP
jgi:hypothetical protein